MFGLAEDDIKKIHDILSELPSIEKVIIYGSRALNRERPGSDIDLALVGDKLALNDVLVLRGRLDDSSLPYLFDISIVSHIENPDLREHIERAGKIFYKRSH